MNYIKQIALLLFVIFSIPMFAYTNISTCQTISSSDSYVLTADLDTQYTGTAPCLIITGVGSYGADIDCNGHSITNYILADGYESPLKIYGNTGNISYHGCSAITGYYRPVELGGWYTGSSNLANNTGGVSSSYNNYYSGVSAGGVWDSSDNAMCSAHDNFYNTWVSINGNYSDIAYANIDLSSSTNAPTGIYYNNANHGSATYITVTGGSGYTLDDCIVYTDSLNLSLSHLTCSNFYDAGIEITGAVSYLDMYDLSITGKTGNGNTAVGCFGNQYGCSVDHVTIDNVTASAVYSMMVFIGDNGAGVLTNNTFSNWSGGGVNPSMLGSVDQSNPSAYNFGTASGNTIHDVVFGNVYVYFQNGSGFSNEWNNYCAQPFPGYAITCH